MLFLFKKIFFNFDAKELSAECLWNLTTRHTCAKVKWKYPLTSIWHDPDQVFNMGTRLWFFFFFFFTRKKWSLIHQVDTDPEPSNDYDTNDEDGSKSLSAS